MCGKFAAAWILCTCRTVFSVYNNDVVVSPVPELSSLCGRVRVCIYVCALSLAGGICVVLFVLQVFPHSDPRGGSRRERHRERERGRESAFAVPSHPHTNHYSTIWKLHTFPLLTKLLSASSAPVVYSSRLICCNTNTS